MLLIGLTIAAFARKMRFIRHDLNYTAVVAVLCLIGSALQLSLDQNQRPLAEVAANKLRCTSPSDNIKEIRLTVSVLIRVIALDRDTKARDAYACRCGF